MNMIIVADKILRIKTNKEIVSLFKLTFFFPCINDVSLELVAMKDMPLIHYRNMMGYIEGI